MLATLTPDIVTEELNRIAEPETFSPRFNMDHLWVDTAPLEIVDLFCGSGGTSTGILKAAHRIQRRVRLLAINHWPAAIATHSLNHPFVRHLCESLDSIDPRRHAKRIHLLTASPECTHHSNARGGKPRSDQSRATAWHILRWAEAVAIDNIIIENVGELLSWGPLGEDGQPLKSKKGTLFNAFINALRALNYYVEWRIVNTADYGDPQCRQRLFIFCRKGSPVVWPEPTHADPANCPAGRLPWRAAKEIIDWDVPSRSIFNRNRPLKDNTMDRILFGVNKFTLRTGEPFLVQLRGTDESHIKSCSRSINVPVPTITAGGSHTALVQPFLMHTTHAGSHRCHSLERPAPTITGAHRGELALVEPRITAIHADYAEGEIEAIFDDNRCKIVEKSTGKTVAELDLFQRMLQPHELAAVMSFTSDYEFTGTKEDQIKMIGNAVPCETAACMAEAMLKRYARQKLSTN